MLGVMAACNAILLFSETGEKYRKIIRNRVSSILKTVRNGFFFRQYGLNQVYMVYKQ